MTRTRTIAAVAVLVLAVGLAWALLQPNDPPVACPRFSYWNWEHGRCVGNLEFDMMPSRVVEQ